MSDENPTPAPELHDLTLRRASFSFEATLEDVSRVAQALRIFTPDMIFEEARSEMEIGVVEALTNIVKHGYQNQSGRVVEVNYRVSEKGIAIELKDSGQRIPELLIKPQEHTVFDFDPEKVELLPEGGMGIALIHIAFDEVHYESNDGVNTLRMLKHVNLHS